MSKLIGQGTFGCVYQPPLECKVKPPMDINPDSISKLMAKKDADKELKIGKIIDAIDPLERFHLNITHSCQVKKNPRDHCSGGKGTLIIYPYGGINLSEYFKNRHINNSKKFMRNLSNLFRGLHKMSKNKFYHFDIKNNNILVLEDNDTYKFRYIDFGLSESIQQDTENYRNDLFIAEQSYLPVEIFLLTYPTVKTKQSFRPIIEYLQALQLSPQTVENVANYQHPGMLSLTKKILRHTYNQIVMNVQMLMKQKNYKQSILDKIDIYSLGIVLGTLFVYSDLKNLGSDIIQDIQVLIKKMIDLNTLQRITPKQAYVEYMDILKKYDLMD